MDPIPPPNAQPHQHHHHFQPDPRKGFFVRWVEHQRHRNHHHDFEHSLLINKVGCTVFLILTMAVYQGLYRDRVVDSTFFAEKHYQALIIIDAAQAGFLGLLSTAFVILFRTSSFSHLRKCWFTLVLVFVILAVFGMAQEGSGLNRYMNKKAIEEGEGAYARLDHTTDPVYLDIFEMQQNGGDPFIYAVGYASILLILFGVFVLTSNMIRATYFGYKGGHHNLSKVRYACGIPPKVGFVIELIMIGSLNGLAPIISFWVRGEEFNTTAVILPVAIFIIGFSLHLMFQWTGLLHSLNIHLKDEGVQEMVVVQSPARVEAALPSARGLEDGPDTGRSSTGSFHTAGTAPTDASTSVAATTTSSASPNTTTSSTTRTSTTGGTSS